MMHAMRKRDPSEPLEARIVPFDEAEDFKTRPIRLASAFMAVKYGREEMVACKVKYATLW